ncbi:MAG: OmpH family outer membrane protein [Blastocatellia bacterium]
MIRKILLITVILLISTISSFAQGSAVKSTAQTNKTGGGSTIAPLSEGKVAVIDSRAFAEGIGEMKKQIDKLEAEFQPRRQKIEGLQGQMVKLEEEIKAAGGNIKPEVFSQKQDQFNGLKKEFEREKEDYQQDVEKRSQLVLGPIQEKLSKFLESYASQRQIVVIFDLPAAAQGGLVFLNPAINVTEDFIKEYNKLNPVAGAPPEPAQR